MNVFTLISIAVTFILLQSVHAARFECGDEPAACKTKFGTQFEKDFKELHLTASRKLFTSYIEMANSIKSQLSIDDPYSKSMEESINVVNKSLQKLNNNLNDNKKIAEAFKEAINGMLWNLMDDAETREENFKKLIELENVRENLVDVMRQLAQDIGSLWAGMYSGLREKDLKAYPQYAELNEIMEVLRGNGAHKVNPADYTLAAEILSEKFKLPYFEAITRIA